MPIRIFATHQLGIRVHEVLGRVTALEFGALAAFYAEHHRLAHYDLVNLVDQDVDPNLTTTELEQLRRSFEQLQTRVQPLLVRRSVWVCPSARAWSLLEAWLHERHSRDAMRIEVCLVADLAQASCLFDESELAAIRDGTGFVEIACLSRQAA